MMLPQRVRIRCEPDETHIIKWTAEGAVKGRDAEYSATYGTRQLPGICWYPAKCTAFAVNQGGTTDK